MPRKIRIAPGGRIPLTPSLARAKRQSNASFETTHRPPVAFPGSLSFTQGRLLNLILRENSRTVSSYDGRRNLPGAKGVIDGREAGPRCFRFGRTKTSRTRANLIDSARFYVRPAPAQWRRYLGLQRPLPQRLPLSLRQIASCILDLIVQQKFPPAAAEVKISHVMY